MLQSGHGSRGGLHRRDGVAQPVEPGHAGASGQQRVAEHPVGGEEPQAPPLPPPPVRLPAADQDGVGRGGCQSPQEEEAGEEAAAVEDDPGGLAAVQQIA